MNRRKFGLLSAVGLTALRVASAKAQTVKDPNLLKTTLTPLGAERAGNADGSIPAWTGGYTTVPDGWTASQYMPDFFADEQPVLIIDANNVDQYTDNLNQGTVTMLKKYPDFKVKVYPTHRTAAAPQSVYDATAANLSTGKLTDPSGRFGFTGAHGGIPFPIPDVDEPYSAGAQILWNSETAWAGYCLSAYTENYAVSNGNVALADGARVDDRFDFYGPNPATPVNFRFFTLDLAPANLAGEEIAGIRSLNNLVTPDISWELLNGQGRVRKAPELSYDTPAGEADGNANYDEFQGFSGAIDKYDWKFIGKKEIFIPYNNNGLVLPPASEILGPHYMNPDYVRWERHRVWVVDATLHPGERHQFPHRRFYCDEDTWNVAVTDAWDANNNLYHTEQCYFLTRPELPGTVSGAAGGSFILNLQNDNYAFVEGYSNQRAKPFYKFLPYDAFPPSHFDPQNMAASAQY
jgi:hypothetical protein